MTRTRLLTIGAFAASSVAALPAHADEYAPTEEAVPGPPRAAPPEYVAEPLPIPPPLGHKGFQMALRTGFAFPIGSLKDKDADDATITGGSSAMKDLTGGQIPLTIDIGGKPTTQLFIGGYFTVGVGLAGGELARACNNLALDCLTSTYRFGAQIQYETAPHDRINPWVGYGLGFAWLNAGDNGQQTSLRGFDFGHFMGGVDFRLSRMFGLGPFVDFTVGKYSHRSIDTNGGSVEGDIQGRAFHYWLTIGPRIVLLP